jgi:hypothetical protein
MNHHSINLRADDHKQAAIQIDVYPVGETWYTRHIRAHDKPYA